MNMKSNTNINKKKKQLLNHLQKFSYLNGGGD